MSFLGAGHDFDHLAFGECEVQKMRDEHSDHTLHVFVYDGGISRANSFCWLFGRRSRSGESGDGQTEN